MAESLTTMGVSLVYIFLLWSSIALSDSTVGQTELPLYKGLPRCFSAQSPEEWGAVFIKPLSFEDRVGSHPPLTDDIDSERLKFNFLKLRSLSRRQVTALYDKVFPNEEFVYLPQDKKILRSAGNENPWEWIYPVGTTFFHRFFADTGQKKTIFELRVIQKLEDRWAFGVYSPSSSKECSGQLELRTQIPKKQIHIVYRSQGVHIDYRAKALDPQSCLDCHSHFALPLNDTRHILVGPCHYRFIESLQAGIDHPLFETLSP